MKNIKILNVKHSFIEAIEALNENKEEILGCVCLDSVNPCIIISNEFNEIEIYKNNVFDETIEHIKTNLTFSNMLNEIFYLLIEDKTIEL